MTCCKTSENSSNPQFEISFGSGGGFTGKYIVYKLNSNGDLNKTSENEILFIKKVEPSKIKLILDEIKKENLLDYKFNVPGNLNKFIEIKVGKETTKILWSNSTKIPKESVISIFDKLNSLIK